MKTIYNTATIRGDIGEALTMAAKDGWQTVCYLGTQPTDPEVENSGGMVFLLRKEVSEIVTPTPQEQAIITRPTLVK